MTTLLVAMAGAAGAVLRYRIGVAVGVRAFPWATLGINLAGCFLLATLLAGPAQSRWGPAATTAVGIGLLGSFTTFSTFGYETFTLLRTERVGAAAAYAAASLVGGLAATAAGYLTGRALA
ncbi:MAG: CrcB family protein [Actinomycetota bacterium]|nr:CrcB family protein [Actinomycetota bacterium]